MSRIFDNLPTLESKNERHPLAYEWCFWQHFRLPGLPLSKGSEMKRTETNDDGKIGEKTPTEKGGGEAHGGQEDDNDEEVDGVEEEEEEEEGEEEDEDEENKAGGIKVARRNITTNSSAKDDTQDSSEDATVKGSLDKSPDVRDAQYLQGTTLLKFPKIYSNNTEFTDTIDSVEQFWESFCNLKNIDDTPIDTEYFFFKKGIKPLWEDESNKAGGKWSFSFTNNSKSKRSLICLFWELLLFKLVSGKFISEEVSLPLNTDIIDNPEFANVHSNMRLSNEKLNKLIMDDIAGIVISVRNKKIIVSIWNTHLSYGNYQTENGVSGNVRNEEHSCSFRERLNSTNKLIYEKLGLTVHQFRQLIFDAVKKTMIETTDLVTDNDIIRNKIKIYRHQKFKYLPHFSEGSMDVKKFKFNSGKMKRNGTSDWGSQRNGRSTGAYGSSSNSNNSNNNAISGNTDSGKFFSLGRVRKKVEFTEEGLMVEEIILRQQSNRKRRPRTTKSPEAHQE